MEEGRFEVDTIRVWFNETSQILRGELSVKINDGSDGKQLNCGGFSSLKKLSAHIPFVEGARHSSGRKKGGTHIASMISAIKSTPFCFNQRPMDTSTSGFGFCTIPAHSWELSQVCIPQRRKDEGPVEVDGQREWFPSGAN